MVVILPKENGDNNYFELPNLFNDFDEAFDYMNELISEEDRQMNRPRSAGPLRVSLKDTDVELWVISRTSELAKI